MGRGRIKSDPVDPAKSIAARIRTAMAACGMKSVAELGRRIGLPRQTVHRWINGDTKNMTHENLYKVADALQVRARWLAVGDTAPAQIDLGDGDVVGLIRTYESMPEAAREQWLAIGRTHLEQAFMAINRAVFQPGRVALPEDGTDEALARRDLP